LEEALAAVAGPAVAAAGGGAEAERPINAPCCVCTRIFLKFFCTYVNIRLLCGCK
jgi:hypothetical protein